MIKVKKLFSEQNMSWIKVILFAIFTAVITAVLKINPSLTDTSFQNIAITLECWILFAVFIITNCKTWLEASLKTFVFFLISQPLIYLIQIPFFQLSFKIFIYYKYWFYATLMTFPGAAIAFQVKRKNWLSVFILSVANVYLSYQAATYFWSTVSHFPHHLISSVFCIALTFLFNFALLDKKSHRITAVIIVIIAFFISAFILQKPINTAVLDLPHDDWSYSIDGDNIVNIKTNSDGDITLKSKKPGFTHIIFTNSSGDIVEYYVNVTSGGIYITKFEG